MKTANLELLYRIQTGKNTMTSDQNCEDQAYLTMSLQGDRRPQCHIWPHCYNKNSQNPCLLGHDQHAMNVDIDYRHSQQLQ